MIWAKPAAKAGIPFSASSAISILVLDIWEWLDLKLRKGESLVDIVAGRIDDS